MKFTIHYNKWTDSHCYENEYFEKYEDGKKTFYKFKFYVKNSKIIHDEVVRDNLDLMEWRWLSPCVQNYRNDLFDKLKAELQSTSDVI